MIDPKAGSVESARPVQRVATMVAMAAVPVMIAVLLLARCVILSRRKPFWFDELVTYYLATDRSFAHMYSALGDQMSSSPPLYHVLCWFWARSFGATEISLRLFSSLCFCGAFAVLWSLTKRRFGVWAAAAALMIAAGSSMLNIYNVEARNYGLFTLFTALALNQFDAWTPEGDRNGRGVVRVALVHGGLVFTHLFGFLYGGSIVLARMMMDLRNRTFSARYYAGVGLAWLAFALVWGQPLLRQMKGFRPYSWVPMPTRDRIIACWSLDDPFLRHVLRALIVAYGLLMIGQFVQRATGSAPAKKQLPALSGPGPSLLASILMILLPPLAAYIVSKVSTPIFVDRYFMPGLCGWIVLLAYGFYAVLRRFQILAFAAFEGAEARLKGLTGVLLVPVVALWLFDLWTVPRVEIPWYFVTARALGATIDEAEARPEFHSLPVVCDWMLDFLPLNYYNRSRSRYYLVLDREASLQSRKRDLGVEMVQNIGMSAMRRFYLADHIVPWERFLADHPRFLILRDSRNRWADVRLLSDPDYLCTPFAAGKAHLWLVERITSHPRVSGSTARPYQRLKGTGSRQR
jgi:hypothetical protein